MATTTAHDIDDPEKAPQDPNVSPSPPLKTESHTHRRLSSIRALDNPLDQPPPHTFLGKLNARISRIQHLEARGIARVPPDSRHPDRLANHIQVFLLWFSANLTANNLAVALLGPLVYGLSFVDCALCAVFAGVLGGVGVGFMSTFGPASGNRTMVIARWFMGYYPSKIACFLNIVIMLGYGMLDSLIGGQILSAVSGGSMSVVVGIVIVAVITWFVAVFGITYFHAYERYAFIPQLLVLFVLIGSAGPKFDTRAPSTGNPETINADRLSFFSLCYSAPIAWTPSAADYLVYYPASTNRPLLFTMVVLGFALSYALVYLLGIGLATATFTHPAWASAEEVSAGALILAGYDGLGGFGKFCGVVVALGLVANNIPGTYSAALGMQIMGRWLLRVPRWLLTCVGVIIYTVCAVAGRNNLYDIFENFLALMGYWVSYYLTIVLEEHLIFHRPFGYDYNWEDWADKGRLPVGLAALVSFLIGWAGAIIGMDQVWWIGPAGRHIGAYGADLGIWLGTAMTMVVYPPLRWLELKKIGR